MPKTKPSENSKQKNNATTTPDVAMNDYFSFGEHAVPLDVAANIFAEVLRDLSATPQLLVQSLNNKNNRHALIADNFWKKVNNQITDFERQKNVESNHKLEITNRRKKAIEQKLQKHKAKNDLNFRFEDIKTFLLEIILGKLDKLQHIEYKILLTILSWRDHENKNIVDWIIKFNGKAKHEKIISEFHELMLAITRKHCSHYLYENQQTYYNLLLKAGYIDFFIQHNISLDAASILDTLKKLSKLNFESMMMFLFENWNHPSLEQLRTKMSQKDLDELFGLCVKFKSSQAMCLFEKTSEYISENKDKILKTFCGYYLKLNTVDPELSHQIFSCLKMISKHGIYHKDYLLQILKKTLELNDSIVAKFFLELPQRSINLSFFKKIEDFTEQLTISERNEWKSLLLFKKVLAEKLATNMSNNLSGKHAALIIFIDIYNRHFKNISEPALFKTNKIMNELATTIHSDDIDEAKIKTLTGAILSQNPNNKQFKNFALEIEAMLHAVHLFDRKPDFINALLKNSNSNTRDIPVNENQNNFLKN